MTQHLGLRDNPESEPLSLSEMVKERILKVLEYTKPIKEKEVNKEMARRILGISKTTPCNKVKEYDFPGFD